MKLIILSLLLFSSLCFSAESQYRVFIKAEVIENKSNSEEKYDGSILISEDHPGLIFLEGKDKKIEMKLRIVPNPILSDKPFGLKVLSEIKLEGDKEFKPYTFKFENYGLTQTVYFDYRKDTKISFNFFFEKRN